MAYDPVIADRIRSILDGEPELTERHMFGGLSFLVNGNLAVAASSWGGLLVRVGADAAGELVETTAATPAEMGTRVMTGWLHVLADDLGADAELSTWLERGVSYARSRPPK